MRWITSVIIVLGLPALAPAATLKVPQQFETISAAVDAAGPGDTIVVSRGVYTERVVTQGRDGLRFIGKGATWDGAREGDRGVCLNIMSANVSVQGFRFRNGSVRIEGDHATFTKCVVRSADSEGVFIRGRYATVSKSTFRGCYSGITIEGLGAEVIRNRVTNMDDRGIEIDGDDAEVSKNTVKVIEDGSGIGVDGDRTLVSRNTVVNTDGDSITVQGNDVTIVRNRCMASGGSCIDVSGRGATVEKNTASMSESAVMEVSGDNFRIVGNKLALAVDDADGMYVSSSTLAGGGLIENNVIEDVVQSGLEFNGNNVTFRGNKVTGQGSEDDEAYSIRGDGNVLIDCQAIASEGDGFDISGDANELVNCKAIDCLEDGFDIAGNGNSLDNCLARDCDAEGLDNEGVGTIVRGGTFLGNRIDICNETSDGATFATFNPKKYGTGGAETEPEID